MLILPFRRSIPSVLNVIPGSVSYTTPGTYSFTVPYFRTLTADVRGAGGGGGGWRGSGPYIYYGGDGTYSYFAAPDATLIGYGGSGGSGADITGVTGNNGANGSAAGGSTNTAGGAGNGGLPAIGGYPGTSYWAGYGGAGGRAVRIWNRASGLLLPKTVITIVVGPGGVAGTVEPEPNTVQQWSTAGGNGAVYISWS